MVDSLKAWFSNLWTHLQSVWEGICNVVQTAVMLLGSIIQGAIDIITLPFQMIWENCQGIVSSVWEGIKSVVSSAIHAVSSTISSVMGAIKNVISTVWCTGLVTATLKAADTFQPGVKIMELAGRMNFSVE